MSLTFPRTDILTGLTFQPKTPRIKPLWRQEISRTAGGVTLVRDLGPLLWQVSYLTVPMLRDRAGEVEADLLSLENGGQLFEGWDPARPLPASDKASDLSGITVHSIWWISGILLIVYGILGRLKDQGINDRAGSPFWIGILALASIAATSAPAQSAQVTAEAFLVEAVPLVARWEGLENHAYLDRIASPPVWTVCHGETRGVKPGDYYTDAQCAKMLGAALLEYRAGLHHYFSKVTRVQRLTPERDAAYTSLAYNAGVYAIGHSTAVRRLNAGDILGGCKALGWWNKAGGRVVRGLVNRRAEETALCLVGVG